MRSIDIEDAYNKYQDYLTTMKREYNQRLPPHQLMRPPLKQTLHPIPSNPPMEPYQNNFKEELNKLRKSQFQQHNMEDLLPPLNLSAVKFGDKLQLEQTA